MTCWDDMRQLEKGWDGYDADPPTQESIDTAEAFVGMLAVNLHIAPSVEGGVGITVGDFYIEFCNDGEISGVRYLGQPDISKDEKHANHPK